MPPRGRRPGNADTRGDILLAAKALFSSNGYRSTSMRAVAREAGVDPALVHHYFPGKAELFAQAIAPGEPYTEGRTLSVRSAIEAPVEDRAAVIIRTFVEFWDQRPDHFRALHRAIIEGGDFPDLSPSGLISDALAEIIAAQDVDQPALRSILAGGVLTCIGNLRWTLRAKEVQALSVEDVVALYAPGLDRFLRLPLPV